MPTLTNKYGLPQAIVNAVQNDAYTKGDADFSVTELLSPPQISYLYSLHSDAITEDVSDRIWSLLGQAVHSIIERSSTASELTETTLFTTFEGKKIKGTIDHICISKAELLDFKVTTVYKVIDRKLPPEWEQQTNIYRWMLWREHRIHIRQMAIIAILRDWSKREASRRPDYPSSQVLRIEVPVWSFSDVESFVYKRLALFSGGPPFHCTEEDIWAKPTIYAVMQKGRKTALKLFTSLTEAQSFMSTISNSYLEVRPGEAVRCQHYCPVASFCPQWQNDPRNKGTSIDAEAII